MLNAQARGEQLELGEERAGVMATLRHNAARLGTARAGIADPEARLRQAFDNRFYDATFESVWKELSARGLADRTASFVTSDHGLSFGEKGEHLYAHNGARPYEYMVRVPLVVRLAGSPAGPPPTGRHVQPVSLTDLFTTIVELAVGPGVFRRSLPVRGHSLLARAAEGRFDPVLVSECSLLPLSYRDRPRLLGYARAVYADGLKLISVASPVNVTQGDWPLDRRLDGRLPWPPWEWPRYERPSEGFQRLYDLAADPGESRDLASARPEALARALKSASPGCAPEFGAERRARWEGEALETLKSLGYVQ